MNQTQFYQALRWILQDKYQISGSTLIEDIKRLNSGEPVDYIIGWTTFNGCHIDLSLKPLIPRPETEFWVNKVIQEQSPNKPLKVLDLCCGSGCIGIAVLTHLPNSKVDFVDISAPALKQTELNLDANHVQKKRFHLYQSDLFAKLPQKKYDLILTNPPYVDPNTRYPKSLHFEPATALFAPQKGLSVINKILSSFVPYLRQMGTLYLEFSPPQIHEIKKITSSNTKFHKDQYNRFRYLSLTQGVI